MKASFLDFREHEQDSGCDYQTWRVITAGFEINVLESEEVSKVSRSIFVGYRSLRADVPDVKLWTYKASSHQITRVCPKALNPKQPTTSQTSKQGTLPPAAWRSRCTACATTAGGCCTKLSPKLAQPLFLLTQHFGTPLRFSHIVPRMLTPEICPVIMSSLELLWPPSYL